MGKGNAALKPVRRQKYEAVPTLQAHSLSSALASFKPYLLTGVRNTKRELGRGSYAVVHELTVGGKKYAGKQLHLELLKDAADTERGKMLSQFANECSMLHQASHPNIVQFIGVYIEENSQLPYLVMELMNTPLACQLKDNAKLETATSYSILSDVALGLHFLHQHTPAIIHRDLSANNVLLSSNMQAKISDLGVAKIVKFSSTQTTSSVQTKAPGTICYMPPEALAETPKYDTTIDIFSFGVLMMHVLSSEWPIPGSHNKEDPDNPSEQLLVNEFDRRIKYAEKIGLDHALMKLIRRCLHNSSYHRPNTTSIMEYLMDVMVQYFQFLGFLHMQTDTCSIIMQVHLYVTLLA